MSKTAIVKSGEQFFIKQLSKSQPIKLDKVIFANISGINGDTEIDLNGSMPDSSQIVHTAPVTQSGLLNDKTVVYSIILDTNVGDFSFNYIGLVNEETDTLCMVMHTDLTRKIKTAGQRQGNTITESIWLEIDNASESTGITVNAQTWQIDYSKRLAGEDERIRLTNYDLYNRLAIHDGFTITKNNNQLIISSGLAYVAGLRIEHAAQTSIEIENNQSLYIDAWLAGTVTGEWSVNYNLIAGTNLRDYEQNGFKHFVERVASVDANGKLVVVKPKSFITTFDHATTEKTGIVKLSSEINSTSETEAATPLAVKTVNVNANNAHNKIDEMRDKFELCPAESRVRSHDKRFFLFVRDDGVVGMYNHVSDRAAWGFNFEGALCEGSVPVERITNLDWFVRERGVPAGVPMPWPQATPPAGWFECNGSPFNTNWCPRLAAAYPWGRLPDLRGEFIRAWDNGRGIDPGRGILSWQNCEIQQHNHTQNIGAYHESGGGNPWGSGGDNRREQDYWFTTGLTGGNETRPRNIAFMYIVKAE